MSGTSDRRRFLQQSVSFVVAGVAASLAVPGRSRGGFDDEDTPGATPVRRLVLVHGRAQEGRDPDLLKASWLEALERGAGRLGRPLPEGLEVAFPYYGDALDRLVSASEVPLTSDIQTRGAEPDREFLEFQAELAEALREGAGVTDEQVDAEYGDNPKRKGPQNWEWVQAMLRAIDKHAGGLSAGSLELFMRDVFLYTRRAGVRDEIDRIVADSITEEPAVVVAHSLGTVVSYSVLRGDRRSLRVPLFLTLGSPLGVRSIRRKFRPLRSPAPVTAWYNAYDRRDVVALYALDTKNFPINPEINNYDGVRNGTQNRHGIDGYLDDPQVVGRILDALAMAREA